MSDDSEFMCCVVRVVEVVPHPGADRLDLATFTTDGINNFPYQIIVGRGEFRAGDLAVYISPDSVVPIRNHHAASSFAFLSNRLDAKDKDRYRIRSARIRGLFSPGLLIPLPQDLGPGFVKIVTELGEDVSDILGVAKWEPVESGIDADELTVPQEKRNKLLPAIDPFPVYSVTALKKCPRLFEEGEAVAITEKIHGTNFRFGYGGRNKFYFGTHRTPLVDVRSWWQRVKDWCQGKKRRINKAPGFGNPWGEAVERFELEEVCRAFPDFVFYGELFGVTSNGKRVQDLTYGKNDLQVRIFDIWHAGEQRWLTWDERAHDVQACLAKLGLSYVPTLTVAPYSADEMKALAEKDSYWGGIREGVVVEALNRNGGTRRKAKWVSERYHLRAA